MVYAYIFEAKKLQSYIFSTGKLRDATGASELINDIAFETTDSDPDDLLSKVLKAARAEDGVKVTRRASAALAMVFYDTDAERARTFRTLWRLAVSRHAPGLPFADALEPGETLEPALARARKALEGSRPVDGLNLPLASPMVRLANRTGLPPVERDTITKEFMDSATAAQRRFEARSRSGKPASEGSFQDRLGAAFLGESTEEVDWPRALTIDKPKEGKGREYIPVFPLGSERQKIAVIHADGNAMGKMFIDAGKILNGETGEQNQSAADKMRELSQALNKVTNAAVQEATREVLLGARDEKNVMPARPILLGGDDLSVIVRSDLAMPFIYSYLGWFEKKALELHKDLEEKNSVLAKVQGLREGLKAKAGVVFIGARQPFARAYELSEELATAAKMSDRSAVSFWRVVSSQFETSADQIRTKMNGNETRLWRDAWTLEQLKDLDALVKAIAHDDVGRGPLRQVPSLLLEGNVTDANAVFQRSLEMVKRRNSTAYQSLMEALNLFDIVPENGPVSPELYCPLLDAHGLAQMQ